MTHGITAQVGAGTIRGTITDLIGVDGTHHGMNLHGVGAEFTIPAEDRDITMVPECLMETGDTVPADTVVVVAMHPAQDIQVLEAQVRETSLIQHLTGEVTVGDIHRLPIRDVLHMMTHLQVVLRQDRQLVLVTKERLQVVLNQAE